MKSKTNNTTDIIMQKIKDLNKNKRHFWLFFWYVKNLGKAIPKHPGIKLVEQTRNSQLFLYPSLKKKKISGMPSPENLDK